MGKNPADDVAAHLNTEVGALTLGTNLFTGKRRAKSTHVPSKSVFCLNYGGTPPEQYCDGSGITYYAGNVQVSIRSDKAKFDDGEILAFAVRDALSFAAISGYTNVVVSESSPLAVGETSDGHHLWTVNCNLWYYE